MEKIIDEESEWSISPYWIYVVTLVILTMVVFAIPWITGNPNWLLGIFFLIWLWYKVLVVKSDNFLKFDKTGIQINWCRWFTKIYDPYSISWDNCEGLSFEWYKKGLGKSRHITMRLIFRSSDPSDNNITVPFVLWHIVLLNLSKINRIARTPILNKHDLLMSFLKTTVKIMGIYGLFAFLLIVIAVVNIKLKSNWAIAAGIFILLGLIIFIDKKMKIPEEWD